MIDRLAEVDITMKQASKGYDQGIAGAVSSTQHGTWLLLDWLLMDRHLSIKTEINELKNNYLKAVTQFPKNSRLKLFNHKPVQCIRSLKADCLGFRICK